MKSVQYIWHKLHVPTIVFFLIFIHYDWGNETEMQNKCFTTEQDKYMNSTVTNTSQ